jgi:hypothetical protein
MRAAKHFEIHEHKKPDGIPSGFFVSEHFQKLCDRKKVAGGGGYGGPVECRKKGMAVENRRHDSITMAMKLLKDSRAI